MATVQYGQSKTLKVTVTNPNPIGISVALMLHYTTPLGVKGTQAISLPSIPANGQVSGSQAVNFSMEGTWTFSLIVSYDGKTFGVSVPSVSTWTLQPPGVIPEW